MKTILGVACLLLTWVPTTGAVDGDAAARSSRHQSNDCFHIDLFHINRSYVDPEECSEWVSAFEEHCLIGLDPDACVRWLIDAGGECVHLDPFRPQNTSVDLNECPPSGRASSEAYAYPVPGLPFLP